MKMRRAAAGLGCFVFVLIAACGGAPAVTPPSVTPAAKPDVAGADKSDPPSKPAADPPKSSAQHKREFMTGCASKAINSPDYCECAWEEFRKIFTDDEMNATMAELPKEKLERVKTQVAGACSSKIPEELVKTGFDKGCIGDRQEMKPYCDCTWAEFRKRFSAAELSDEETVKGDRFIASRGPVVKACAAKMNENVAKDIFTKGCAKDPKADKFCACAWKELRKAAGSAAEVQAGLIDDVKMRTILEKGCAKVRPK